MSRARASLLFVADESPASTIRRISSTESVRLAVGGTGIVTPRKGDVPGGGIIPSFTALLYTARRLRKYQFALPAFRLCRVFR